MRHKAGKENETQTKHTGRNIVIAVVVVLAAFCAYAAALVHSAMVIKDEVTQSVGVVRDSWHWCCFGRFRPRLEHGRYDRDRSGSSSIAAAYDGRPGTG